MKLYEVVRRPKDPSDEYKREFNDALKDAHQLFALVNPWVDSVRQILQHTSDLGRVRTTAMSRMKEAIKKQNLEALIAAMNMAYTGMKSVESDIEYNNKTEEFQTLLAMNYQDAIKSDKTYWDIPQRFYYDIEPG